MAQQVQQKLNDVDIEKIGALIERYKQDPAAGKSQWNARVQWLGGFRSEAQVRNLPAVRSDEPDWLAGTDTGPNAVELVLSALGSCLAVGYAANATARGIRLDSLEIALQGDVDLPVFLGLVEGNAGYNKITAKVYVKSDAPPEQLKELTEHVFKTSPVGNTIAKSVTIAPEVVSAS